MAAWSIPGSLMLSVQLARPVTRAGSSLRSTPPPTNLSGASVTLVPPSGHGLVHVLLRQLHGLHDVLVARATAEVAFETLPDLLLRRVRLLLEEAYGGHDHARRAVAALQPVRLVEGLLHRMPEPVLPDALHRRDLVPVGLHREKRARLDRLAVEQHRAGPAVSGVAARMHTSDPQVLPEVVDEQEPRLYLGHVRLSIYRHLDPSQRSSFLDLRPSNERGPPCK